MKIADLLFYGMQLLRRLPLILGITIIATIVGLVLAQSQAPTYRATATILVEAPEIPSDLARSTVLENAVVQVQIIQQKLLTDQSLLDLADRFSVYPEQDSLAPYQIAADMQARIGVDQALLGNADRSATAFKISFEAAKPSLAADVANYLATTILRMGSERRTDRANETLTFFQEEVALLSSTLASVDTEIQSFKSAHLNDLPDSLAFRRTRQSTYEERLLLLDREASALRNRRANLVTIAAVTGRDISIGTPTPQGLLLADLQRALLTQSTIYGPASFPVQALNERIAQLRPEALASDDSGGASQAPTSELDLQLADIDDQLVSLDAERETIKLAVDQLVASIGLTPQNEVTLQVLERKRTSTEALHELAVERLAEATTGAEIETRLKGERLSLVEAATPPEHTQPSKKRIIVGGAFGGGLAAALALVAGLELLNRRIRRPIELTRQLEIRPMATIPYLHKPLEIWRRLLIPAAVLLVGAIALVPLSYGGSGSIMGNALSSLGSNK